MFTRALSGVGGGASVPSYVVMLSFPRRVVLDLGSRIFENESLIGEFDKG